MNDMEIHIIILIFYEAPGDPQRSLPRPMHPLRQPQNHAQPHAY